MTEATLSSLSLAGGTPAAAVPLRGSRRGTGNAQRHGRDTPEARVCGHSTECGLCGPVTAAHALATSYVRGPVPTLLTSSKWSRWQPMRKDVGAMTKSSMCPDRMGTTVCCHCRGCR